MKNYEEMYYELLYENKRMKRYIKELEEDIKYLKKEKTTNIDLNKELKKEINNYFKQRFELFKNMPRK